MDTIIYISAGLSILGAILIFIATLLLWRATEKLVTLEFLRYAEIVGKDMLTDSFIKALGKYDKNFINSVLITARAKFLMEQFPKKFEIFGEMITQVINGMISKKGNSNEEVSSKRA